MTEKIDTLQIEVCGVVDFREAALSPCRVELVGGVGRIELASAAAGGDEGIGGLEIGLRIAALELPRARRGNIPGKPGGGKNVLAPRHNVGDGVVRTPNRRVERGSAAAASLYRRRGAAEGAAIAVESLDAVWKLARIKLRRIVLDVVDPAFAIILKVRVETVDVHAGAFG